MTDPGSVASRFAAVTFEWDTALDRSRAEAQVRSAALADPTYAAVLRTAVPATGDATFTDLAAHHGWTTAALTPNVDDGRPTDELRAAARSYTVTVTGHGDDGWTQAQAPRMIYVFLARPDGTSGWVVERAQFRSTTGTGR